jgi:hypothetical protein
MGTYITGRANTTYSRHPMTARRNNETGVVETKHYAPRPGVGAEWSTTGVLPDTFTPDGAPRIPAEYTWTTAKGRSQTTNDRGIRDEMERRGMRHGELTAHMADLNAGHTLTANDGTTFQRSNR